MTSQQHLIYTLAPAIQPELVKIGQDQVRKRRPITGQLLCLLDIIQIRPRRFGFDVSDLAVSSIPDAEVRITGLGLLGKDSDRYLFPLFQLRVLF